MLSLSKTQIVRAAETLIQHHAQARSTPIVLWAGLDESREAFALRCAAHQNRGAHKILAAVPHGFPVPAGIRPVEFAPKCFRVLHPTRRARFKVLKGGRGSAKSWSIARALVLYSLEEPLSIRGKFSVEEFTPVRRPQPGDPWSATASKPWDGPYMGADWGFSQDPTTAVKCWIHEKTLYIEHEAYGVGVDIDKTPALFDTIPDARKYLIRADNARPEMISYMQQNGYPRVQPCAKWKNCAEYGVTFLRSYEKIIIHPRCERTAEEFRLFSYKVDRLTGDVLPDLVPTHDHCIDALRYAVEPPSNNGAASESCPALTS